MFYFDDIVMWNFVDYYVSDYCFFEECDCIFCCLFVVVVYISEFVNLGDFLCWDVVGLLVLLIYDKVGNVNVFLNVCWYCGMCLVDDEVGCKYCFLCLYYVWIYVNLGELIVVLYLEVGFGEVDCV